MKKAFKTIWILGGLFYQINGSEKNKKVEIKKKTETETPVEVKNEKKSQEKKSNSQEDEENIDDDEDDDDDISKTSGVNQWIPPVLSAAGLVTTSVLGFMTIKKISDSEKTQKKLTDNLDSQKKEITAIKEAKNINLTSDLNQIDQLFFFIDQNDKGVKPYTYDNFPFLGNKDKFGKKAAALRNLLNYVTFNKNESIKTGPKKYFIDITFDKNLMKFDHTDLSDDLKKAVKEIFKVFELKKEKDIDNFRKELQNSNSYWEISSTLLQFVTVFFTYKLEFSEENRYLFYHKKFLQDYLKAMYNFDKLILPDSSIFTTNDEFLKRQNETLAQHGGYSLKRFEITDTQFNFDEVLDKDNIYGKGKENLLKFFTTNSTDIQITTEAKLEQVTTAFKKYQENFETFLKDNMPKALFLKFLDEYKITLDSKETNLKNQLIKLVSVDPDISSSSPGTRSSDVQLKTKILEAIKKKESDDGKIFFDEKNQVYIAFANFIDKFKEKKELINQLQDENRVDKKLFNLVDEYQEKVQEFTQYLADQALKQN
jgi:hypothetical protein